MGRIVREGGRGSQEGVLCLLGVMGLWPRVGSSVENADHPTTDVAIAWQLQKIGSPRLPLAGAASQQAGIWMIEHAREYTCTESGQGGTYVSSESGWQ